MGTERLPRKINYTRANLSVMRCASKDNTRYNCNTIAFDPNGSTIATDGHTLAVYTPAGVDRRVHGALREEEKPIALEIECVKAIHKTIGAKGSFDFIDDENTGTAASTSACITLPTMSPERAGDHSSWEFPQWTQVLPQPKEPVRMRLNAQYLKRIAEAAIEASGLGRSAEVPVDITVDNGDMRDGYTMSPVSFEHETADGAHFLGIVMPMRK